VYDFIEFLHFTFNILYYLDFLILFEDLEFPPIRKEKLVLSRGFSPFVVVYCVEKRMGLGHLIGHFYMSYITQQELP
jgi:hypothetical protein